jgi:hypothetical protein
MNNRGLRRPFSLHLGTAYPHVQESC